MSIFVAIKNVSVKPNAQRELASFGMARKRTDKNVSVKPNAQRQLAFFGMARKRTEKNYSRICKRIAMKQHFQYIIPYLLTLTLLLTGCKEQRVSYVDMIKREKKEIAAYIDKEGISTQSSFPSDLVTPQGTFVQVPDVEGLYVRVVRAGDLSLLVNNKTIVVTRFELKSISPRSKESYNIAGGAAGGTQPLPFVYVSEYNTVYPNLVMDPAAVLETNNSSLLCRALLEAVKIAGLNSEVEIITSFRHGPSFATEQGIPVAFTKVTFSAKR